MWPLVIAGDGSSGASPTKVRFLLHRVCSTFQVSLEILQIYKCYYIDSVTKSEDIWGVSVS